MKMRTTLSLLTVASLVLLYGGAVQADVVTGKLWHVLEAFAMNATHASLVASGVNLAVPDVAFTTDSALDFSAGPIPPGTSPTVRAWLLSDTGINFDPLNPILDTPMDGPNGGTIVEFTGHGMVTPGQSFTFRHDDGITLSIGNPLVALGGFTSGPSPNLTQTGNYSASLPGGTDLAYQLVYGECCLGPAILDGALPTQTAIPEPSTYLLFATGLLGLLGYGWRRRKLNG